MKPAIIYYSKHHGNTKKLLDAIAEKAIKRQIGALVNNLTGGKTQGASTLTCQLVKLTMLSSDQNYRRKVQEAYLALELE